MHVVYLPGLPKLKPSISQTLATAIHYNTVIFFLIQVSLEHL